MLRIASVFVLVIAALGSFQRWMDFSVRTVLGLLCVALAGFIVSLFDYPAAGLVPRKPPVS